ncbi:MAG: glycerol-3-phosphate 1-O-acyltransferase PlsY [Deltaproteobacteria bacterium]|nr:glycerol-3-phosphate 1-O-acyltransferase PlsY [Deltaproteobacteria bacterium]
MDRDAILAWVLVGVAYLAGSIPFGLLIARARGVDIQAVGSGNIGATNVARNLGKKLGALVLMADMLKGGLPMAAARWLLHLDTRAEPHLYAAVGLAAVLGHCFPVWLRFKGGKGVATALGVFLVVDPLAALLCIVVFALAYATLRISAVGSLAATIAFPAILWLRDHPMNHVVLAVLVTVVIVIQHRGNLGRLRRGEEHEV